MNYELVNVNSHATRFSEILGIHKNEGYIIIGAFLTDTDNQLSIPTHKRGGLT